MAAHFVYVEALSDEHGNFPPDTKEELRAAIQQALEDKTTKDKGFTKLTVLTDIIYSERENPVAHGKIMRASCSVDYE